MVGVRLKNALGFINMNTDARAVRKCLFLPSELEFSFASICFYKIWMKIKNFLVEIVSIELHQTKLNSIQVGGRTCRNYWWLGGTGHHLNAAGF
jgi:hypothetical protein